MRTPKSSRKNRTTKKVRSIRRLSTPEWYQPCHRLWDDFCRAMVPNILHEPDWQQYKLAHDTENLREVQDEIDRVAKLLER